MKKLFEEPVLDQMYEFRKDDFEQTVYEENKEIKDIELNILEKAENFIEYLKEVIPNSKNAEKAVDMFENYQLKYVDSMDFWCKTYFKLGMIEREEIKKEFFKHDSKLKNHQRNN